MRFLMICMHYPVSPGESYMTTELAAALVAAGHEVEVLLVDWAAEPDGSVERFADRAGIRVVRCAPRSLRGFGSLAARASKFVLTGRYAARALRSQFDLAAFDVAIAWMPATAIAPVPALLRRANIAHRLLFIWDFFPDHHLQIGTIPAGPPYWIARWWEQQLLAEFSAIICTLPGNADYLRNNYRLRSDQRVLVTPIWSDTESLPPADRASLRAGHGLPADAPIAVFGGQLVEGRGFEQMLAAADAALDAGSPLAFLFVGEGRLAPMICAKAVGQANVLHLPAMPRDAYLALLGACDVGMVATVPGVTSFSIPTKTIDYLRAGLPVISAVEHGNDFVSILDTYGVGRAVPFDEPVRFMRETEALATDAQLRARARSAAPQCLDEIFDVRHAVAAVMKAALS